MKQSKLSIRQKTGVLPLRQGEKETVDLPYHSESLTTLNSESEP